MRRKDKENRFRIQKEIEEKTRAPILPIKVKLPSTKAKTVTEAINLAKNRKITNFRRSVPKQLKPNAKEVLETKLNERLAKPVEPPFTALQSFNAAALVLSYIDYQEDIEPFLNRLSHNARAYYVKHRDILDGILEFRPTPTYHPIFNDIKLTQKADR